MKSAKLNSKPKVSIVCVTYNQKSYILKTLNSFISQETSFDYEIIIGDDASTDGTADIIQDFYLKHMTIVRPIFRTKNVGGRRNLQSALELVSTDYIAYCEGDDFWIDNNKLQKQYEFLESNLDYGLVWTDINIIDEHKRGIDRSIFKNKKLPIYDKIEDIIINKPFFAPSTWFFRSKYYHFFLENDYVDGTLPFVLELLNVTKMKYFDQVTGVYTKRIESVSNSKNLVKNFNFACGVFKIQMHYGRNVSKDFLLAIEHKHYNSLLFYSLIAEDTLFMSRAHDVLRHSKELHVRVLLFVANKKALRYLFGVLFRNGKLYHGHIKARDFILVIKRKLESMTSKMREIVYSIKNGTSA